MLVPALRAAALVLSLVVLLSPVARADWRQLLDKANEAIGGSAGPSSLASTALANDEIVAGLKEALAKGAERAIGALGQRGGYLDNANVRIPLPGGLQKVESALRMLGQDRYADDFVVTMNRAAEAAVPEASAIVGDAVRQLTVEDARSILDGPDDAATQYFRRVGESRLTERMLPIVADATDRAGVTSSYKALMDRAGVVAAAVGSEVPDLDRYVTSEALDGLFWMIAQEEKRIRENPAARTTELLQKVFGAASP